MLLGDLILNLRRSRLCYGLSFRLALLRLTSNGLLRRLLLLRRLGRRLHRLLRLVWLVWPSPVLWPNCWMQRRRLRLLHMPAISMVIRHELRAVRCGRWGH